MKVTTQYTDLTDLLAKIIAERDEKPEKGPSNTIQDAVHLIIAIENAKNVSKECPVAKVDAFKRMISSLQRADYSRLNLPHLIRHSIDSGTSDGTIPKLYAVNPQHVVPKSQFTVQFFGKFKYCEKYKPSLIIGKTTFYPTNVNHHTLTFQPQVTKEDFPYKLNKCTQIFCRLVVPYETGYVRSVPDQFEFCVPIRALPLNPGTIEITSKMLNDQTSTKHFEMGWEGVPRFELSSESDSKLKFTSFDGKTQEFQASDLEEEAKKCLPNPLVKHGSYITLSQISAAGQDRKKWDVKITPPVDL